MITTLLLAFLWQTLLLFRIDRFIWADGLVEPWFIHNGLKFHRDFYSTYLQLPKIVMIPINMLTNWHPGTTIVLGFILSLVTVWLIGKLSYKLSKGFARNTGIIYFAVWYTYILAQNTFEINLLIGFLTLSTFAIFVKWLEKPTRLKVFLMGLVGASAVFSIQHAAIPLVVIYSAVTGYFLIMRKGNFNLLFTQVWIPLGLGIGAIVIPTVGWFYLRGTLYDFYFWVIDYYFRDTGYPFSRFGFSDKDNLFFAVFALPLIFMSIALISELTKKKLLSGLRQLNKENWIMLTLWSMLAVCTLYARFAIFHPRRLIFVLPIAAIAIPILVNYYSSAKKYINFLGFVGLTLFLVFCGTTIAPWYYQKIVSGTKVTYYNQVQPGDPDYLAVNWIKDNTPPQSTLFVLAGNTLNFFEAERLPANRWTYAIPWVYEPFDMMAKDLIEKPADYWIVDDRLLVRFIGWGYPHQVDYINTLLARDYTEVQRFDWMGIYKRNQ